MKNGMNLLYYTIYININKLKLKSGLTNRDLAVTLNVSESFIKNISQSRAHYNIEHIFILINEYEWDIKDIIPNSNNLTNQNFEHFYNKVLSDYFSK